MKKSFFYLKEFFRRADILLLVLCLLCAAFGLVLISSATRSYGSSRYVIVQGGALVIGVVLFILLTVIDLDIIADHWLILLLFNIAFLLLLIPFGVGEEEVGNRAWIRFFGIGIQPTEVVKIVYIVLMAKQIAYLKEYKNLNSPLSIIQLGAHFALMFVLIIFVSDDLGSALVFLFIFAVMLFAGGVRIYWFLLAIAAVAALTPIIWDNFLSQNQQDRIMAPYDPSIDPTGYGLTWQSTISKLALAGGRIFGMGLYRGTQSQSSTMPEKESDFIFAVAGEELGMIACLIIMALLSAIIIRCMVVGIQSHNTMSMLTCSGVAASLFFQMLVNTGMCMGITPVIGITLPFFSYGGSSLMATFAAVGLVSGAKYRPTPKQFHRY